MADEVAVTRLNPGADYAVTIPDGYAAGDIVVIRLLGKVFVEADVLEALVRAYHEAHVLDDGLRCRCGVATVRGDENAFRAHAENAVREALAGRAYL